MNVWFLFVVRCKLNHKAMPVLLVKRNNMVQLWFVPALGSSKCPAALPPSHHVSVTSEGVGLLALTRNKQILSATVALGCKGGGSTFTDSSNADRFSRKAPTLLLVSLRNSSDVLKSVFRVLPTD